MWMVTRLQAITHIYDSALQEGDKSNHIYGKPVR